jgi:putative heme iron utilization protein
MTEEKGAAPREPERSSHAESCRELASRARHGALATTARDPLGFPFATLVAVAFDGRGRPLLLLSKLAEHTKNLEASPRASLLVTDAAAADPLASGRMTLVGTCARVPEEESEAARAAFLAAHPEAKLYAGFVDFAIWRLEVAHVRWVGGFGRMDWVDAAEYRQ